MNDRIKLDVYVDLDRTPGPFHSKDSARNIVGACLLQHMPHYNPTVSVGREGADVVGGVIPGDKYICTGLNCAVYVFGASSSGVCPSCDYEGMKVHPGQLAPFLEWYETARSRPITNS